MLRTNYLLIGWLCLLPFFLGAQEDIDVYLVDPDSGEPLIGVTVFNQDQSIAEVTDVEGRLTLKGVSKDELFTISYVGFEPMQMTAAELKELNGPLSMQVQTLGDTIVVIGRRDDKREDIPYQIANIRAEEIQRFESQSSADVLEKSGAAFIQRSQLGGGSVNLRGFEANKVLMVVDGVRLNNAIYRGGHLQNAITVDQNVLQQMEVIYGPGSLVYGSEALGGVVHFRTKDPKLLATGDKATSQTGFMLRGATATLEKSLGLTFEYNKNKWASFTALSYKNINDLRSGSNRPSEYPDFGKQPFYASFDIERDIDQIVVNPDPDIQRGSGYSQIDVLQKLKWRISKEQFLTANMQFSSSTDVPRYDAAQEIRGEARDLRNSEVFYGPQKRLMLSLKYALNEANAFFDRASFIGAYQKIHEDRFRRRFANSRREFNKEDVNVYSFSADFDKKIFGHDFLYGVDVQHNKVVSIAGRKNIYDNSVAFDILTRYPNDEAIFTTGGLFVNYKIKDLIPKLQVDLGARYSTTRLKAKYKENEIIDWPDIFLDGVVSANSEPTWSVGLGYGDSRFKVQFLAGSAFRSPNIDDFAKIRLKNGKLVVPNLDLQPEKTLNTELNVHKAFGQPDGIHGSINASVFYTSISNLITRVDSNTLGDLKIVAEGEEVELQTNINANEGYIYGGGVQFEIKKGPLSLTSNLSQSFGRTKFVNSVIDTLTPISHIPPLFGATTLTYDKGRWSASLALRYNGAKKVTEYAVADIEKKDGQTIIDRVGTSDNIEFSPVVLDDQGGEIFQGAYAWTTWNTYFSYKLSKKIKLSLAVENILDLHYRQFSSGISAPGRNIILSIRGQL